MFKRNIHAICALAFLSTNFALAEEAEKQKEKLPQTAEQQEKLAQVGDYEDRGLLENIAEIMTMLANETFASACLGVYLSLDQSDIPKEEMQGEPAREKLSYSSAVNSLAILAPLAGTDAEEPSPGEIAMFAEVDYSKAKSAYDQDRQAIAVLARELAASDFTREKSEEIIRENYELLNRIIQGIAPVSTSDEERSFTFSRIFPPTLIEFLRRVKTN